MKQPETGVSCYCKPGVQRDSCPWCMGTGWQINFAAIRNNSEQRTYILMYAENAVALGGKTPEAALVEAAEMWDRKVAAETAVKAAFEKVMSERKGK